MRVARLLAIGLCLVGLSVVPALAQGRPTGGVLAGAGVSKVSPAGPNQSVDTNPSFLVGAYAVFPLTKTISFMPEVVYTRKGGQLSTQAGSTNVVTDLNLDYIEIPLLAKMGLFKSIYMTEGVALGFPIRAQIQPATGSATDVKSQVTSPDVATVLGGGVPIGRRAGIEFRYTGGIRRINTTTGAAVQRNRSYVGIVRVRI